MTAEDHTPRERIEARLAEANIDTDRAVNVEDGAKVCYDHDDRRPPTEWTGNYGLYATARDTLVILDVDEYRDLEDDHPGLNALDRLPETLTQKSPHIGKHRIYSVTVSEDGRLPAAVFEDELGQANPVASWGEVQVANKYIIGAGSELDSCGKDWHDCSEPGEGRYELVNDERIAIVSIDEMLDVLLADPEITEASDTSSADAEYADDVDISVHDVLLSSNYPEGKRTEHPTHGSSTGANFQVDEGAETWRCWRHGCTGNALHLIGMQNGIIECGEWEDHDLSSETWADIFDAAREQGFDVGDAPSSGPTLDAVQDAETDGGVDTADDTADTGSDAASVEDRIHSEVLIPYDPPSDLEDEVETITKPTVIDRAARIFDDEWAFIYPRNDVQGWVNELHYYDEESGIYVPYGKDWVETTAEELLGDLADNQFMRELVGKLERRNTVTPRDVEDLHPGRLVVKNGILDLRTGELDDHTPEELHRTRLDVAYDPDAECPEIDSFFHDIVAEENVPTLYRLVAHTLYKDYASEKAAMLVGDGQNGKSVFLSLIEEFLGEQNVAGRSPQEIVEKPFAMNNLHNKMANLHPDMSDESVNDISQFKQLTGGDRVTADIKYTKPVNFENHATMIFAANGVPQLPEDNHAVWRRWIYINFPNTFDGEDQIPKRVLMRRLTQDSELQGLLARCVEEISAWWDGREWFPDSPGPEETREQLKRAAEPVYDFAKACLEDARDDDEAMLPKEQVREAYRKYAREEGLPTMADNVFGERLQNIRDYDIDSGRSRFATDGSSRDPVYYGVSLTPRGEQLLGIYDPDEDGTLDDLDRDDDDDDDAAVEEDEDADEGGETATATADTTEHDEVDDDADMKTQIRQYVEAHPDADHHAVRNALGLDYVWKRDINRIIEDVHGDPGDTADGDPADELGEYYELVRDYVEVTDSPTVGDVLAEFPATLHESQADAIEAVITEVGDAA